MAATPVIPCKGLFTSDSPLSAVPVGSLALAENCVAQFADVLEPRRGQGFLRNVSGVDVEAGDITREGVVYGDSLILHTDDAQLQRWDGSTLSTYAGTYQQPEPTLARMRFLEVQGSLYFNTDAGLYTLESEGGTPRAAGIPRAVGISHSLEGGGTTGGTFGADTNDAYVLADDAQHAVRIVWGRRDANGKEHLGPPSERVVVANKPHIAPVGSMVRAGSTVTVTLTEPMPDGLVVYDGTNFSVDIHPGETDFPEGRKTINYLSNVSFTYTEAGAATSNTAEQEIRHGPRRVGWEIDIPASYRSGDFFRLYRTRNSESAEFDPGDECFLAHEGGPLPAISVAPGGASATGSPIATYTVTHTNHGYLPGQYVTLTGGGGYFANGTYAIASTTADTFTYYAAMSVPGTVTSTGLTLLYAPVTNIVFYDEQPEALLGLPLYTNANTGGGFEAARYRPPVSRDLCQWQGRTWFANTTDAHRFTLQILGTSSPDGIQSGDTITIGGRTYTATASSIATPPNFRTYFLLETPALNIAATARSLCRAINRDLSSPVWAYVDEAENEVPGTITLEARAMGGSAFSVYASRPASYWPTLTTSSSGAQQSTNDRRANGLSYSEFGLPQAVPLGNFETAGPDGAEILRAIPARDKLWVFLSSGQIFTVTGTGPFRIDEFDGTAKLLAADSAVRHSNQLFAFTSQGIVAISDGGVRILSKDIEPELLPLMTRAREAIAQHTFGVSYESDRQYILALPTSNGADSCEVQYVYNSATGRFTRWRCNRTWGLVHPDTDLLYMGDGASARVRVERKNYSRADYADEAFSRSATLSGTTATLTTTSIEVGDAMKLGSAVALITEVGSGAVTLSADIGSGAQSVEILKGYECEAKWRPIMPGGPNKETHFNAAHLHFGRFVVNRATVLFDTEYATTEEEVELEGRSYTTDDGDIYDSPPATSSKNRRVEVPSLYGAAVQLRVGLRIREAYGLWALHGYSLEIEPGAERVDY